MSFPPLRWLLAAALTSSIILPATADDPQRQTFASGPERTTLLELYTSEGCSSCPPADRWIGDLHDHPGLWREVVPIAFHVDYWDDLGWPDRFASPRNTQRQRAYRRQGALRSVYTPAFVVDGREWRGWFTRPTLKRPDGTPGGRLDLQRAGPRLSAAFEPPATQDGPFEFNVAVLGFGLRSDVRAGENSGRELVHDFTVLGQARLAMTERDGRWHASGELPATMETGSRQGLAAWITRPGDLRPLQATGGWLASP